MPGYKEVLLRTHEDGTVVTRAYTGKTCRVVENSYTQDFDEHRRRARAVPDAGREVHAGRGQPPRRRRDTPDVDPDREFWPAGQGVGAIDELVPAGELVERFVREAEEALGVVSQAFA